MKNKKESVYGVDTELDFGMFRGTPLHRVPNSYLHWMVRNLTVKTDKYPARIKWARTAFDALLERGAHNSSFFDIINKPNMTNIGIFFPRPSHEESTLEWDMLENGKGGWNLLKPGLLLVCQVTIHTPLETLKPGQCILLVGKTDEEPYGLKHPLGNWKCVTPAGETVWSSIQNLVKGGAATPATACNRRPRVGPNGDQFAFPKMTPNGVVTCDPPPTHLWGEIWGGGFKDEDVWANRNEDLKHDYIAVATWEDNDRNTEKYAISTEKKGFSIPDESFDSRFDVGDSVIIKPAIERGGKVAEVASKGKIVSVYNNMMPIMYQVDTGYFATSKIYEEKDLEDHAEFGRDAAESNQPTEHSEPSTRSKIIYLTVAVVFFVLVYFRFEIWNFIQEMIERVNNG